MKVRRQIWEICCCCRKCKWKCRPGEARQCRLCSAARPTLPRRRKAAVCIKYSGIVGRKPRKAENWRTGAHYRSSQARRHSGPAGERLITSPGQNPATIRGFSCFASFLPTVQCRQLSELQQVWRRLGKQFVKPILGGVKAIVGGELPRYHESDLQSPLPVLGYPPCSTVPSSSQQKLFVYPAL